MSLDILNLEELSTPETNQTEDAQKNETKHHGLHASTVILTVILISTAALFIFLGVTNYKSCSDDPKIHIWLITVGLTLFLERTLTVNHEIVRIKHNHNLPDRKQDTKEPNQELISRRKKLSSSPLIRDFLWLFIIVLSGIGFVWLLLMPDDSVCDLMFYTFFVFCSVVILVSSILFCCICTNCCQKN
ncbi:unnamed protein product [Caenorhabditis brenneri]